MIDGTSDWYWPVAEELNIPTMVHAPVWKAELGQIASSHPGLKIIIDHLGIMARCVDDADTTSPCGRSPACMHSRSMTASQLPE